MSLGKNIRKYRRAAGMRQWQLAERLGIKRVSISKYETGLCLPPVTLLKPLAKALNVSADALLEEED